MNGQPTFLEIDGLWLNLNTIVAVKFKPKEVCIWMIGDDDGRPWSLGAMHADRIRTALTTFKRAS